MATHLRQRRRHLAGNDPDPHARRGQKGSTKKEGRPEAAFFVRFETYRAGLATVAIRVARDGALDVVPAITHGTARFAPRQARVGAGGVPVALEVAFDVLELLALVLAIGVVAVLVGRLVVAPLAATDVIRGGLVGALEMLGVLGR